MEHVPTEFADHPEQYFAMLEKQEIEAKINKLEKEVDELSEKNREYGLALHSIACSIRVWSEHRTDRRRIPLRKIIDEIEKTLSKFPEETRSIDLEKLESNPPKE